MTYKVWRMACLALVLVASACTGSSEGALDPDPVETAVAELPTPTVEVIVEEPTATPEPAIPAVSDADLIDVVLSAFDGLIEDGTAPEGIIAYDVLGSEVGADGNVTLNICAWTGDTVFDTVRDSLWRTEVAPDGGITATHITSPLAPGECLNTHLIETALETVEEFDAFWQAVEVDPGTFADAVASRQPLLNDGMFSVLNAVADGYAADGVQVIGSRRAGSALTALPAEILWRRFERNDVAVLEIAFCREMDPRRGLYRDGALIDDGKPDTAVGPHSIDALQLEPEARASTSWIVSGRDGLIWADCTSVADWRDSASSWRSAPVDFSYLSPS